VLSFTTGFVSNDGFVVLNFSKIVRRYLKSWFLLDFIVVGSDWIEIILSAGGNLGFARLGKASRTIRIIRMLRLLRLARMREVLAVVSERIYSEKVVIFADIFKILIIVVGLAHFIACLWYGLGISENLGWVEESGFTRKSLGIRYAMSLHWSIAQFAGGMDEVTPASLNERVFAICMFILAFIISGVFVSSITSSMTQLNIIGSHQTQHLSILRRYLHQNGIPNKLAMRVQRNAQYAVTEQQRMLPEQSVKYLQMVSEPLRVEIHLEMYAPIFMIHPFFETYLSECPQVMRKVCHLATSTMNLSAGDVIFSAGETPAQPKMYIVNVGCLEYCHLNGERVPIEEGTCISEACLWCHWVHQGVLTAATDARLCVVDAKKFQSIAHQFEHNEFDPKVYANDFVNTLNSVQDPSDVADHHPELHADMLEEKRLQEANYEITGFWAKSPLAGYLARRKKRQNEKRIQSELKRTMTQHAPRVSGPVRVASNPRTA
jgi:CRP-like cAMP-binding protein